MDRWFYDDDKSAHKFLGIPKIMWWLVHRFASKQTYAQGIGRHSEEEVIHITRLDLEAISNYLGE